MRKSVIEENNQDQIRRQREFRQAADVIAEALAKFPEITAIGVTGSVAKSLWKEVPRFRAFRRAQVEIWHECFDVDLAVWLKPINRLNEIRRAKDAALRDAYLSGAGISVANHQAHIFLFEPQTDRYLGRLCSFNACPKDKPQCQVPGCGTVAYNRVLEGFVLKPDLLETARNSMLFERRRGIIASALDLPGPGEGLVSGV
jgi:hypothetical protein